MNSQKWYKIKGNGELVLNEKKDMLKEFLNEEKVDLNKYIKLTEIIENIVNEKILDAFNDMCGFMAKKENEPLEDEVIKLIKIDASREQRSYDYEGNVEIFNRMVNKDGDITASGKIVNGDNKEYSVSVLKTDDKIYGRCNCEDFKYRGRENNFPCKHIIAMCRNVGIEL